MVFPGQSIADALGGNEAELVSSVSGDLDLRGAEIARGLTASSDMSVHLQAAMGLGGGFHTASVGLDMEQGAARPVGWQPEAGPEAPQVRHDSTLDMG